MSTTIFEKQGTNLTVYPKGRLDTATSLILEQELQQYLDGVQYVTMDFAEVEYITSGGLAAGNRSDSGGSRREPSGNPCECTYS